MLRTRVATALVLLLILVVAAAISLEATLALGAVILGLALAEWLRLSGMGTGAAAGLAFLAAASAGALALAHIDPAPELLAGACALGSAVWLAIGLLLVRAQRSAQPAAPVPAPWLVAGALVLAGVAWLALVSLLREGYVHTLSVLALVWLADIAAYFAGRVFGVRKLASRISPGKTWAGVWGALLAVVLGAEAVRWWWPSADLWSTRLLVAAPAAGIAILAALVALSIVGDLFESLVKRQAGAKDSGKILPGHGGVWDRIDASLPALPVAVLSNWLLLHGALGAGGQNA